jgi:beta-galactosidase
MVKAMGLNTLSVYMMWNHHESRPDVFDFSTENKNLTGFLELAKKHGMNVLLRPGPYVCAEWDFGGLPYYLIKDKMIELRSTDPYFLNRTTVYFSKVAPLIKPYLAPNGPIIMIQIENEYGSWGGDHVYIQALVDIWKRLIGDFEYYHADGDFGIPAGHAPGLNIGINGCLNLNTYKSTQLKYPDAKMVFGGEIYPGWLTHWGEAHMQRQDKSQTVGMFRWFIQNNISFSMYMVHGGSNFGFTNGVNSFLNVHVTSYDYDAPINEHGLNTPKYDDLRTMFKAAVSW